MFKKISFCSIFSIATIFSLFSCASTPTIPTNIRAAKINIDTIITNTDMGEFQVEPSNNYIIENFIYAQAVNAGHPDLINDLNVQKYSSTQATVSVIDDYSEYTGSVEITWTLKDKIDIVTIFTNNLTNTYSEDDLLAMNLDGINNYMFIQTMEDANYKDQDIRWNQLQATNVDFTSATAKYTGLGTITIEPINSDVYIGSANVNFSLDIPTMVVTNYASGNSYEFTAPKDGNYILEAWGSRGGTYGSGSTPSSGGGYVSGTIYLEEGQKIYIYVGNYANTPFNGGGTKYDNAGAGGGATDFRLLKNNDETYPNKWSDPLSLNSRIMVAGGGGGDGDHQSSNWHRGQAGGINGYPLLGEISKTVSGGTQTSGGLGQSVPGKFGIGNNNITMNYGGAGGGGYYGGSANSNRSGGGNGVGGTGGSSFISGYPGCIAIANPLNDTSEPRVPKTIGDISVLNYNEQDYIFNSYKMIDAKSQMYLWNGSTQTGNINNGYARISYFND